jgi:hypothetical protein
LILTVFAVHSIHSRQKSCDMVISYNLDPDPTKKVND